MKKSVKRVLLALAAVAVMAGSAFAADGDEYRQDAFTEPTPYGSIFNESNVMTNVGTLSIDVKFDVSEAGNVKFTNATSKAGTVYSPTFNGVNKDGIAAKYTGITYTQNAFTAAELTSELFLYLNTFKSSQSSSHPALNTNWDGKNRALDWLGHRSTHVVDKTTKDWKSGVIADKTDSKATEALKLLLTLANLDLDDKSKETDAEPATNITTASVADVQKVLAAIADMNDENLTSVMYAIAKKYYDDDNTKPANVYVSGNTSIRFVEGTTLVSDDKGILSGDNFFVSPDAENGTITVHLNWFNLNKAIDKTKAQAGVGAFYTGFANYMLGAFYWCLAQDANLARAALAAESAALNESITVQEMFAKLADATFAGKAADAYLASFLSADVFNDREVGIDWTNSTSYGNSAAAVKATVTKGTSATVPMTIIAANTVDGTKFIPTPKLWHAEMASFDSTGKITVTPVDVTAGIEITPELAAKKQVAIRAIFLASGDNIVADPKQTDIAKYRSVGVLTTQVTNSTTSDVTTAGTLPKDAFNVDNMEYAAIANIAELQQGYPYLVQFTLEFATADAPIFDKATLTANYVDGGKGATLDIAVTSKDTAVKELPVDAGTEVSFDVSAAATTTNPVSSVTLSSGDVKADGNVYTLTAPATDGASVDVTFKFVSGDGTFDYVVRVIASGDAAGEGEGEEDTYVLNASNVIFTGNDGSATQTVAAETTYSTSQTDAPVWATVTFRVSSDVFADFAVEVSTDNAIIAVYAPGDTEPATDVLSGDVLDFAAIEGIYKVVFSADIVLSGDAETLSDDEGYFAINVDVASVEAKSDSGDVDSGDVDSGDTSGDIGDDDTDTDTDTDTIQPGEETTPEEARTEDKSGNYVAEEGKRIENAFTGANGEVNDTAVNNFFNNATAVAETTTENVAGALGISEDQLGDATKGYKAVGFEVPNNITMPEEGTPIYVFVRGSNGGSRHVGFGYMPKRRAGFERILAIMFNLFRNPFNTSSYMQIDAGLNEVGATDSNGTTSGDEQAAVNRLVFVTADGPALQLKTSEAIPLQGQGTDGKTTEIVPPSGDDDTDTDTDTDTDSDTDQPTSSRGGSSGCDAGFGALALLAVAGALAARKVRK